MVDRLLGRNREAPPDAPLDAKADVWRRVQAFLASARH